MRYRTEDIANIPVNESAEQNQQDTSASQRKPINRVFTCSVCSLKEQYDYKGTKPPFARQLIYLEECYIIKDPFSLPNRGEVLIVGSECSICKHAVCLACSIFYVKRFCPSCAFNNMQNLPSQLHSKIKNLINQTDF